VLGYIYNRYLYISFDSMKTVTIDNVVYDVYNYSDADKAEVVFVDQQGFIAKVEQYDYARNSTTVYEYEYTFEDLDMSIFKLDNDTFQCSYVDERFYEEPVMGTCETLSIHDPSETMCAFGVETKIEEYEGTMNYTFYLSYMDRKMYPVLALEDTETKIIYRGDLVLRNNGRSFISYVSGINGNCSHVLVPPSYVWDRIEEVFAVFLDDFSYLTEEQLTCGEGECTKYCKDLFSRTCVTVLNSEPRHVLKYESASINITYGIPFEVEDLAVFTLDKDKFPNCGDGSKAYEEPKICSSGSSQASSHASSQASSQVSSHASSHASSQDSSQASSTVMSESAASFVAVTIVAFVLAVAVALL